MMKLLCCVRDVPAQSIIGIPMLFPHVAVAVRWFTDLLSDPAGIVSKHPRDYEMVHYADYDESGDFFIVVPFPAVLMSGEVWLSLNEASDAQA